MPSEPGGSFRTLADEIPSLVYAANALGRTVYCNRRLQAFTGLDEPTLLGGGWLLAIHEEDRPAVETAWRHALAAQEPFEAECRLRAADGHYHWFLIRCAPARSNGVVDHWIGTGVDIHDRKLSALNARVEHARTQDLLAESEAKHHTIFRSMFNFAALLSADGTLLEANQAALTFGGVKADEVCGLKLWDTSWWDAGEETKLKLRGAVLAAAAGEVVRYEAEVRASGGRLAAVDFALSPVIDAAGAVRHIIAEGRDLTQAKTVERALRESQARVQRIVDSGIVGVGFGHRDGAVSDANDALLKMIGRSREDLDSGRITWRALTAPEHLERDAAAMAEVKLHGRCTPYEKDYILPDRRLPVQIAVASLEPATADTDHVALIVDLTAQKAAQAALAASKAELERRVLERTAQLRKANERLLDEMKRREAIQSALLQSQRLETLGQLTSSVAHDFNNVLAAIIGGFSLIQSRATDPRIKTLATEGNKAAERGADLIRKLLAFARRQQVAPQRVELGPLFDDLAPQLRHLLGAEVDLAVGAAQSLPAVEIDAAQLQAAVTNLVVNARDAMGGRGRVAIEFEDVPADHGEKPQELGDAAAVAIRVRDDGAGMGTHTLQRVLEPFFTTKAPGKGTGLGLAMVHGLMIQAGGALRIDSVVGRGTCVSMFLPVSSGPLTQTIEEIEADLRTHAGGRVLLVEDDEPVRAVIAGQLAEWGYEVVQCDSAVGAMTVAKDGQPLSFVVTDQALAAGAGADLAGELRDVRPNLPILFITGQADPRGLDDEWVLKKPFDAGALSSHILTMLADAGKLGEAEAALDRLAARLRSRALLTMLTAWRRGRRGRGLPTTLNVDIPPEAADLTAEIAVDQTRVPMTFVLVSAGAELARRAGTDLSNWRLPGSGDDTALTQEGAYRRCVRSRRPTYEFARFDFGDAPASHFERLLLPCCDDGSNVTRLIAVVSFDAPTPPEET